jgi:16S rRNA (guanine(966)-N(2))-methyltransferase RsmD
MLRIITGTAKNKKIEVPDSARPITDRIRTSIFDTIKDFVPNAKVLDLYSGSGAFAIEALSRGAASAVMVEKEESSVEIIKLNLINTKFQNQSKVIKSKVEDYLTPENIEKFDIIMLDPPFPLKVEKKNAILIQTLNFLTTNGILIFRYPTKETLPENSELNLVYSKKYGISIVNYYKSVLK